MRTLIHKDGSIEAVLFDNKTGVSHWLKHKNERPEWWAWNEATDNEFRGWREHPDPDGMWARYIAAKLADKIEDFGLGLL